MTQTTMTTYSAHYIIQIEPELEIEAPEGLDNDQLKQLFIQELLKVVVGETQDMDIIHFQHFDVDGDEL